MSERGEPLDHDPVGWDTRQLAVYFEALRQAEEKFQAERDRRYTEVKQEQEKALKIKEEADERALGLASANQRLRDEAANQLREQINSERNLYATKDELIVFGQRIEALIQPSLEWVSGRRGRDAGTLDTRTLVFSVILMVVGIAEVIALFVGH